MRKLSSVVMGVVFIAACGGTHGAEGEHGGGAATEPPTSVVIAPISADAIYVINGEDATISVLDATASKIVGTIALKGVT